MTSAHPDEETPLFRGCNKIDIYDRFSPARKRGILALASFVGILPLFVAGIFVPLIPQIANDMNSTLAVVSLVVSIAVFATSIGSLLGSSYSTFYGRRPIYLVGLPIFFISSICVACSQSTSQLLFWRFFQALGSSPGLTIGAAVIGDIYKLEERGTALGIFSAANLMGQAFAPLFGGLAAHYSSWRMLQAVVGFFAFWAFVSMFLFFPETLDDDSKPKLRPVWINPLRPLTLLRSPNLLFVSLAGFTALLSYYVLVIPIAYTLGERYGIKNEALIGACILPSGLGNIVGALTVGRISDRLVVKWRAKRGGRWYPEDRLRAAIPSALVIIPLSVFLSGLIVAYVPGNLGIALNLVCLFLNGIGTDGILGPTATYFVDCMQNRSAEALAANSGFRQVLNAIAISGIIPMVGRHGVVWTNTLASLLTWVGCLLLLITIRYGDRFRAVIDTETSSSAKS